jgi:drug/metabolite transporter (DMT)-like permease
LTRAAAHAVLCIGLVCVSTSGPFYVMTGMDPYAVVLWRMGLAAPLFLAWSAARGELRVAPGEGGRLVAGALLLAFHFLLWVKAFQLTDYASNLLLLVAQPVMAAVVAVRRGERTARGLVPSIVLATSGLCTIAGGDFALGGRALVGDLMCIVAGMTITVFYIVTRAARAGTPLGTFMGLTFAIGAAITLPVVWIGGAPVVGYPAPAWGWLAALVLVTTVAGHGLINLAARHVSLFTLNIVIVLEPAIAILLGALLFGASAGASAIVGGLLLVAAVGVGLRNV